MRIADAHQILVNLTPAQAQFANGIVERHGAVVKETMARLRTEYTKVSVSELLH